MAQAPLNFPGSASMGVTCCTHSSSPLYSGVKGASVQYYSHTWSQLLIPVDGEDFAWNKVQSERQFPAAQFRP
jgi:hypothetical protein